MQSSVLFLTSSGFSSFAGCVFSDGFSCFIVVGDLFAKAYARWDFGDFDVWHSVACRLFLLSVVAVGSISDPSLYAFGDGSPQRGGIALVGGLSQTV